MTAIHIAPQELRDYLAARPRIPITTAQIETRISGYSVDAMLRILAQDRSFGELEEQPSGWLFTPAEGTLALIPERCESRSDEHDLAAARTMLASFDQRPGLRCGDWLEFPDGQLHRAALVWRDDGDLSFVQPGYDGCFYHLGRHGMSMGNGSLYLNVPPDAITPARRTRTGDFWITGSGSGRTWAQAPFRVFTCSADVPEV